jgi:diguanylate cyclase (GGDEF)-like protein
MDQEWNRALRDGSKLSLVLLDIDHFKAYNDCYGHPVGDDCLIQVAAEISGQVSRPGDQVARNGGEEFAVLLPGSDLEGARTVAESIRSGIQALQIEHRGSETESVVTVSLGLATLVPSEESSPRGLMLAADQALYRAKAEGRNRVCIGGQGTDEVPR